MGTGLQEESEKGGQFNFMTDDTDSVYRGIWVQSEALRGGRLG